MYRSTGMLVFVVAVLPFLFSSTEAAVIKCNCVEGAAGCSAEKVMDCPDGADSCLWTVVTGGDGKASSGGCGAAGQGDSCMNNGTVSTCTCPGEKCNLLDGTKACKCDHSATDAPTDGTHPTTTSTDNTTTGADSIVIMTSLIPLAILFSLTRMTFQ